MKALALTQPWASLVAVGAKRIETRGWSTRHRGPLLIYAAKRLPGGERELEAICSQEPFRGALRGAHGRDLPRGRVVAAAELSGIWDTDDLLPVLLASRWDDEIAFGDYTSGRFAWQLDNVRAVEPPQAIPRRAVTCYQGLFDVPDAIAADLLLTAAAA